MLDSSSRILIRLTHKRQLRRLICGTSTRQTVQSTCSAYKHFAALQPSPACRRLKAAAKQLCLIKLSQCRYSIVSSQSEAALPLIIHNTVLKRLTFIVRQPSCDSKIFRELTETLPLLWSSSDRCRLLSQAGLSKTEAQNQKSVPKLSYSRRRPRTKRHQGLK